ncbi:hypothetical protein AMTRI_Chr07g79080 [Amborella trichopoda]
MRIELCFSRAFHPQIDYQTTLKIPFEIVYVYNLSSVLDLTPIPHARKFSGKAEDLADQIKDIHEQFNKLSNQKIGPCEILKKISDNAYKIKLTSHMRTSDVFNVKHLIPFVGDTSNDKELNSRMSSLQPREDDAVEIISLDYLGRSDHDRQ